MNAEADVNWLLCYMGPTAPQKKCRGFRRRSRSDRTILTSLRLFCLTAGFSVSSGRLSAEQIVRDVIEEVDKALANRERREDGGAYERLILVGYSCGAVIARKIAIVVHGETAGAPFVKDLRGLEEPGPEASSELFCWRE